MFLSPAVTALLIIGLYVFVVESGSAVVVLMYTQVKPRWMFHF